MEKRKSFVFHAEWAEALADFTADVRLEVYEAAVRYAVTGETEELRPLARMAFGFIKGDIDMDRRSESEAAGRSASLSEVRSEAGRKGAESRWQIMANDGKNGKNGKNDFAINSADNGGASDSKNALEMAQNGKNGKNNFAIPAVSAESKEQKERTKEKIENIIEKENTTLCVVKEKESPPPAAPLRFVPPTVGEVADYAASKGYAGFEAARFCDFYESKGWMVGKNKMKDWRAAVRNWNATNKAKAAKGNTMKANPDAWVDDWKDFENKIY